jgi:ABC-type lipoprotein export system ATPase subunit
MVTHDPELARRAHRNVQLLDGQIASPDPFLAADSVAEVDLKPVA